MENKYCMRALHLLAEDARLTARTRHLVVTLIWATPVALRGHATMIPLSELISALSTETADAVWHGVSDRDVMNALEEVDVAHWRMPSLEGAPIGSFLNGHALSAESGLLHFQIDNNLIAAIEQISQQLQADSNEPPELRH
ncbi:hypothetical protein [Massilia putida]|uniref:hypothetical protein n=1 Tax=Massilia putida TaxID=1141883 RepID=UPI000952BE3B|nr:hypothetical protein [Massilia putida]